jgi:enoyl-CoA hydratase/carnithine racemase
MAAVHKALDQVEASTGPGCLVIMGTGDRMFSTGFNLKYWAKEGVVP